MFFTRSEKQRTLNGEATLTSRVSITISNSIHKPFN